MAVIITIAAVLLVICSLLVLLLVMIQDDQGEGFALFGSSGQNPFNTGKNPLARFTGYLGISFGVLALVTALLISWSSNQRTRLEQLTQKQGILEDSDWFLKSTPVKPGVDNASVDNAEEGVTEVGTMEIDKLTPPAQAIEG